MKTCWAEHAAEFIQPENAARCSIGSLSCQHAYLALASPVLAAPKVEASRTAPRMVISYDVPEVRLALYYRSTSATSRYRSTTIGRRKRPETIRSYFVRLVAADMSSQPAATGVTQQSTTTNGSLTDQSDSSLPAPTTKPRMRHGALVWLVQPCTWISRGSLEVLKSFTKTTVILSLVLAILFGSFTWYGVKAGLDLATWTAMKDYLDYCHDNVVRFFRASIGDIHDLSLMIYIGPLDWHPTIGLSTSNSGGTSQTASYGHT